MLARILDTHARALGVWAASCSARAAGLARSCEWVEPPIWPVKHGVLLLVATNDNTTSRMVESLEKTTGSAARVACNAFGLGRWTALWARVR